MCIEWRTNSHYVDQGNVRSGPSQIEPCAVARAGGRCGTLTVQTRNQDVRDFLPRGRMDHHVAPSYTVVDWVPRKRIEYETHSRPRSRSKSRHISFHQRKWWPFEFTIVKTKTRRSHRGRHHDHSPSRYPPALPPPPPAWYLGPAPQNNNVLHQTFQFTPPPAVPDPPTLRTYTWRPSRPSVELPPSAGLPTPPGSPDAPTPRLPSGPPLPPSPPRSDSSSQNRRPAAAPKPRGPPIVNAQNVTNGGRPLSPTPEPLVRDRQPRIPRVHYSQGRPRIATSAERETEHMMSGGLGPAPSPPTAPELPTPPRRTALPAHRERHHKNEAHSSQRKERQRGEQRQPVNQRKHGESREPRPQPQTRYDEDAHVQEPRHAPTRHERSTAHPRDVAAAESFERREGGDRPTPELENAYGGAGESRNRSWRRVPTQQPEHGRRVHFREASSTRHPHTSDGRREHGKFQEVSPSSRSRNSSEQRQEPGHGRERRHDSNQPRDGRRDDEAHRRAQAVHGSQHGQQPGNSVHERTRVRQHEGEREQRDASGRDMSRVRRKDRDTEYWPSAHYHQGYDPGSPYWNDGAPRETYNHHRRRGEEWYHNPNDFDEWGRPIILPGYAYRHIPRWR